MIIVNLATAEYQKIEVQVLQEQGMPFGFQTIDSLTEHDVLDLLDRLYELEHNQFPFD